MAVKIGSKNVFVSVYYRPPNQSIQQSSVFLELQVSLDMVKVHNPDTVIILGDFNDPCLSWYSKHVKSELKDKF